MSDLDNAARSLHAALTEPSGGACTVSHAPRSLLVGHPDQSEIEQEIRDCARAAGEAGAVLILALLGHGITSGGNLYFMAGNSRSEELTTTVDVGSLLKQVIETPGLSGLIAIMDTCYAAGAAPDVKAIASGIRQGNTRLSLLMGAGQAEEAFELRFSKTITKIVQDGVEQAAERLSPEAVLRAVRLDGGTVGQDIYRMDWDGAQFQEIGLWLAYNRRHTARQVGRLLGPLACSELDQVLPAWRAVPGGLDEMRQLEEVEKEALQWEPQQGARARALIEAVRHCIRTRALLAAWPGRELTSKVLRRSLVASTPQADGLPTAAGNDLLRDAVEYIRLRAPRVGQRSVVPLVQFVTSLAMATDVPPGHPDLRQWAVDLGADIDLNDAWEQWKERDRDMRLRLIISLHAAVSDEWPESLTAWLLDGKNHYQHREFVCRPDRSGVELQVGTALSWASDLAESLDVPLKRVEIAAPAQLLVRWRPEETYYGRRLGDRHDVVLRWSERMQPPEHLFWINHEARHKLHAMAAAECGQRVHWIEEAETCLDGELQDCLESCPHDQAVALSHRPAKLGDIMVTLLTSSPIVLWPEEGSSQVSEDTRRYIDESWHHLPGKFSSMYRERRQNGSMQSKDSSQPGHDGLHRLRAVWDDLDYLDFCRWFKKYTTEERKP
ncbi:vWA-MoxR associated conflict system protein [Streptomyces lonarensis]|uniref:vWA-MoxR associated conflict system protein n=1 Tax=Streptomyces lonarensis TaxID=700599 RepID=UPI001FD7BE62|nr:hypothetical protein [Streptomyces lonarensis]